MEIIENKEVNLQMELRDELVAQNWERLHGGRTRWRTFILRGIECILAYDYCSANTNVSDCRERS